MRFRSGTWPALAALTMCLMMASPSSQATRQAEKVTGTAVDLLLVLAADVSNSVDPREHFLQREGYAMAITHPRVLSAIMTSGALGRIAVCYVEWSGSESQDLIADWTVIARKSDALEFAEILRSAPRLYADRTSISGAIDFAIAQLWRSPFDARRRIIDVSGDGTNTNGRPVSEARDDAVRSGVVINGLVILNREQPAGLSTHTNPAGGLKQYFETNVIGGPGAFVFTADGFETFGDAIISKLVKEIASAPVTPTVRVAQPWLK